MAKLPRRASHFPRGPFWLIGAQQHALAFLTKINIRFIIYATGQTRRMIGHRINFFGEQIMMFHRLHRQMHALHMPHFARPEPPAIHDMLGIDHPFGRAYIPAAISALRGGSGRRMREILRPINAGGLCKRISRARGIQIPILIIPKRGKIMAWIDQWMPFGHLFGADKFLIKPHIARFRALAFQIIIPGFIRCQIKPARDMKPNRMSREFFNFFIKVNCITLQTADIGIAGNRMNLPRRMPA